MATLFEILDGINSSDYAAETLKSTEEIIAYAEACDTQISEDDALRIQKAGLIWRDEQENGNGEWGRMRLEAKAALDD